MGRKRIRAPLSFGVASVCVAACSSMNPLTKSNIQSSMEAEELIAPVEVATELQGIDAIPVAKAGGPLDGSPEREAGSAVGSGNLDPVIGQAKAGSQVAPSAVGGVAGKSAMSGAGGLVNGKVEPATASSSQAAGSNGVQGFRVGSVGGQRASAGGATGVIGKPEASGADAVAMNGQSIAGKDALIAGSGDAVSAQPLNADGSPVQLSGGGKDSSSNGAMVGRGPASADGAQIIDYRVKEGDTLMKIAFEVFGDLTRWREIHDLNKEVVSDPNVLTKGTRLRIKVFGVRTVSRNGEAYLIKRGDTLHKISQWVYGTFTQWKKLWDNNRELIRDPNRIFAGFKLYFVREQDPKRVPAANPAKSDPHDATR